MKPYLVFRLYGPMASWGLPAVGGDRQTAVRPSRSAILGLLGAAMGIKRENESALFALQSSVRFGIKQMTPSTLVRDYHTSQVPSSTSKGRFHTRKSELSQPKLNTILSSRDYRCDGLWVVAVFLNENASVSLEDLKSSLLNPVYSLCLGRKSCPLALPLQPKVLEPCALKNALDTPFSPITWNEKSDEKILGADSWVTYFWEGDKDELKQGDVLTTHPWDEPKSRARWQFTQCTMHQVSMRMDTDAKGQDRVEGDK